MYIIMEKQFIGLQDSDAFRIYAAHIREKQIGERMIEWCLSSSIASTFALRNVKICLSKTMIV